MKKILPALSFCFKIIFFVCIPPLTPVLKIVVLYLVNNLFMLSYFIMLFTFRPIVDDPHTFLVLVNWLYRSMVVEGYKDK